VNEGLFQIGEVADRVGLSLRTVRYYEEMKLVEPSDRTAGGFRLYTEEDVDRLMLVKQMKPLGFTLDEMRDLLDVRERLRSGELDDEQRLAAVGRLAMYAAAAGARIDDLRAELEAAESFVDALQSETARYTSGARRRR
jgi:DNA-binding transcriptional MerR regulator